MGFLIAGCVGLVVGVALFFVQRNYNHKARALKGARSATVAELSAMAKEVAQEIGGGSWRDYVKLAGDVVCDRPLTSELKQEPCVIYRMSVRREYEETVTRKDSEGKTVTETQRGSETVSSNEQRTPFILRDRSGDIWVDPDGAQVELTTVLDEFRPESAGGLISYGRFSLAIGNIGGGRRTLGYRYCESVLPLHRRATILAAVSDQGDRLTLCRPDDSTKPFMISLKSEAELTKAAEQGAKYATYGAIASVGLGAVLLLVGLVKIIL
ncbi:E3 ubiquitin ligase family protein [Leptolyngbya sp. AN02str]|uniref:E3 ubiquitin ligase family protein n=1 Tax=Leptolyngbya sp. AN02str TaxID=3423363 RepID=UPI003D3243AF